MMATINYTERKVVVESKQIEVPDGVFQAEWDTSLKSNLLKLIVEKDQHSFERLISDLYNEEPAVVEQSARYLAKCWDTTEAVIAEFKSALAKGQVEF
jgi:hypothetical protein